MLGQNFQRRADTSVKLDEYVSDLNLEISPDGYSCQPLHSDGFAYMWAGSKATYGVRRGKVCFEVKIVDNLQVSTSEFTDAHIVRVGWSTDAAPLQLGEDKNSFGYGGTAKKSEGRNFSDYGRRFDAGDVVGCYLSIGGGWVDISYCVNGYQCGTAFKVRWDADETLFPHILTKNCRVEVNFGQAHNPYYSLLPGYKIIGNLPVEQRVAAISPPSAKKECEVIMMVGLPGVGKTTWAANYVKLHPEKKYNILGTDAIIDKMRVQGLPRKNNFGGRWDVLIKQATECFNVMLRKATTKSRNLVLDQTNVYASARKRKVRQYKDAGYTVNAMVLVPTDDDMISRTKQRTIKDGKDVPEAAVYDMKANFSLPHEDENLFSTITFLELQREDAESLVAQYNMDASLKGYKSNKQSGQGANENQKEISEKRQARQHITDTKLEPNRYARPDISPSTKQASKPPMDQKISIKNDRPGPDSHYDRNSSHGDSRERSSRNRSDPPTRRERSPERYRGRGDRRRDDHERRDKNEPESRDHRDRSRGDSRDQHRRESRDGFHDKRREDSRDRPGHARDSYRSRERERERDEYRKRTRERQDTRDVNKKTEEMPQYGLHENRPQSINQAFFNEQIGGNGQFFNEERRGDGQFFNEERRGDGQFFNEERRGDEQFERDQWARAPQEPSNSSFEPPSRQQGQRSSQSHIPDGRDINRLPDEFQRYGDFPPGQEFYHQQSNFKSEGNRENPYPPLMQDPEESGRSQRIMPQSMEWKNNECFEREVKQNMGGILRDRPSDDRNRPIDLMSMGRNNGSKSTLQGREGEDAYGRLMDTPLQQRRTGPPVPQYSDVTLGNDPREEMRRVDGNSQYPRQFNQGDLMDSYTENEYKGRGANTEMQSSSGRRMADAMQGYDSADQPGRFPRETGNMPSGDEYGPPAQHSSASNVGKDWADQRRDEKFYESLSPRLSNVDFEALRATLANVQQAHEEEILALTKGGSLFGRDRPGDLEHKPTLQSQSSRGYQERRNVHDYEAEFSEVPAQQLDVYNAHKKQLARGTLPERGSERDERAVNERRSSRSRTDQRSAERHEKNDRRRDEERDERPPSRKASDRTARSHYKESQRHSPHPDDGKMSRFSVAEERHSLQTRRRKNDDRRSRMPDAPKSDPNEERPRRVNEDRESKRQRRADAPSDRMQSDKQGFRDSAAGTKHKYPPLLPSADEWSQQGAVETLLTEFPESDAFLHERPPGRSHVDGDRGKPMGLLGKFPKSLEGESFPALMQDFDAPRPTAMKDPRLNTFRPRNPSQRPPLLETPGAPARQPRPGGSWHIERRPPRPPQDSIAHGRVGSMVHRPIGGMNPELGDEHMAYDPGEDLVHGPRKSITHDRDGLDLGGGMVRGSAGEMAHGPSGGILELPRVRGPRLRPVLSNSDMPGISRSPRVDMMQPRPRGANPYLGPRVRSQMRPPYMGPRNLDHLGQGEAGLRFRSRAPWDAPRGVRARGPRPQTFRM